MIPSPRYQRPSTRSKRAKAAPPVVRPAEPRDLDEVAQLAEEADMGTLSDRGLTYVAEQDGALVGFIRLLEDEGQWYVNPVVVAEGHRRQGIGQALMTFAHDRYGELRFVARGSAVPFYETLGCHRVPWETIAPLVADDCDDCSMKESCHPLPMAMA